MKAEVVTAGDGDDGRRAALVVAPSTSTNLASARISTPYEQLLRSWLDTKSAGTVRVYHGALRHFAAFFAKRLHFAEAPSSDEVVRLLAEMGKGSAKLLIMDWMGAMKRGEVKPRTIMWRVSALRSVLELAEDVGLIPWTLKIRVKGPEEPAESRVDPIDGRKQWLRLRRQLEISDLKDDVRDLAILRLLHDCALRRFEVAGVEPKHVDIARSRVAIRGKGKDERRAITMSAGACSAVARWLELSGIAAGRLFLCPSGISAMMERRREQLGIELRPHDLRRLGITRALELTGGDLAKTQHFSRHANPKTVLVYDQRRKNAQGEIANLVGADD